MVVYTGPDTIDELSEVLSDGRFDVYLPGSAMGAAREHPGGADAEGLLHDVRDLPAAGSPQQLLITPFAAARRPAQRARHGAAEAAGPSPATLAIVPAEPPTAIAPEDLELCSMSPDALDKIVARLDSPDMVSLSSTCKTMQSAVSAKWLWEAALGRDFPQRIPLKLEPHRSHPQHVYAAQFKHIVDATRRRTLSFFEPEKIQSNTFVFAPAVAPPISASPPVAIPQQLSHIALSRALEAMQSQISRVRQRSFARGCFFAHGLAALEGVSRGFMDALLTMRHQGQSLHYWNMWMQAQRTLCDAWVDVLTQHEEVPSKLRDKYLAFIYYRMEWQDGLRTVGHWDSIRVPLNRLVPTRVADRLCVYANADDCEDEPAEAVEAEPQQEEEQEETEAVADDQQEQEQQPAQQEDQAAAAEGDEAEQEEQEDQAAEEDEQQSAAAEPTHARVSRAWAHQEHLRLLQRLESSPGISQWTDAKRYQAGDSAPRAPEGSFDVDVRPCPTI